MLPWSQSQSYGSGRVCGRQTTKVPYSTLCAKYMSAENKHLALSDSAYSKHLALSDSAYSKHLSDSNFASIASPSLALMQLNSKDRLRHVGQERVETSQLRNQSEHLVAKLDLKTQNCVKDIDQKLSLAVNNQQFWKAELNYEREQLLAESEELEKLGRVIEKFMKECEGQLRIAEECLYQRDKIQGVCVDVFPDSVGKDLTTEVQLIVQSQQAACAYLSRICNQIDLNRVTQHRLEKNSAKSEIMAALDSRELQASTGSSIANSLRERCIPSPAPDTCAESADRDIKGSQMQRAFCKQLRSEVERFMQESSETQSQQWNQVGGVMCT
ncbi:TEKT3 [Bugula neritina]|uniref:Tektin n=1 Tax=Bugula neritina TaxID=10212 RepID=A0A7J7KP40_BUGNE|nr:TEKT3 [Bugula neritina]